MLAEALAALAGAGGSALVGAMVTDAWQVTRDGVAGLFGRGGPQRQAAIETQLDSHAALVSQAEDAGEDAGEDADEVRPSLAAVWRLELAGLLRRSPDAEDELRALVAQIRDALPDARQTWVQTNLARDHATQNIVQHGDLHIHPDGSGAGPR
jgi:hypothetical protein